ncbi:MAG: ATP-dependent DNA helicase [Kosmotoga sp.]|uniref:ATP-dependent DNA helicase n=1 Tax=Kosmotoga sp. TaxID=1955248 RepID=UPI0025BCBA56|nr:ATP-dependent DNA helicase [Kosmotoga sp.]MCD6159204.1 ATP-dependent DNA helicase [Kosmotoga sp.]
MKPLIMKVFKSKGRVKVKLTPYDGGEGSKTIELDTFSDFLKDNRIPPLFPADNKSREQFPFQELLIDESFLINFLHVASSDIPEMRISSYGERVKKLPRTLKPLLELFLKDPKDEVLKDFIAFFLDQSSNEEAWEDTLAKRLTKLPVSEKDEEVPNIDLIKSVRMTFSEGGLLEDIFEGFEFRQEQLFTAMEIAENIIERQGLMIEAGTGTGKSLAYLVPVAYYSVRTGKHAVISTKTRTLQDQLLRKDIPVLKQLPGLQSLTATVLKGRERYICLKKFMELLEASSYIDNNISKILLGILFWSILTETGDLDEILIPSQLRKELGADKYSCNRQLCPFYERCPYFIARENATRADLIITNHALLFSEAAIRLKDGESIDNEVSGILLPDFELLIIDEAHELENSITEAMSFRITPYENAQLLRSSMQVLKNSLIQLRNHHDRAFLEKIWKRSKELIGKIEGTLRQLVIVFGGDMHGETTRIQGNSLKSLIDTLTELDSLLKNFRSLFTQVSRMIEEISEEEPLRKLHILENELRAALTSIDDFQQNVEGFLEENTEKRVFFTRKEPKNGGVYLAILSSPVESDRLMERTFPNVPMKIFISATLWVHSKGSDGFNYARRVLGLPKNFHAVRLGSSFDYSQQLKFFVVKDMDEYSPGNHEYLDGASRLIKTALSIVKGGSMVLFTSYSDMKYIYTKLSEELAHLDLKMQRPLDSPTAIIEEHLGSSNSVIFGVRTFWEGIDLPGEHLKLLILFKLPFDRPDDPLINARVKHFGPRNFMEGLNKYYYPKMITAFRQGLGRLLRTKEDRGVVIVFDRRIVDARRVYSRKLLGSLPPEMAVEVAPGRKIIAALRKLKREKWL